MKSLFEPTVTPVASSLRDVMSEQAAENPEDDELARALAESLKLAEEEKARLSAFSSQDDKSTDCTSDETLARMLQQQFDAEYQSTTMNQSPKAKPVTIVYSGLAFNFSFIF